MMSLIVRGLTPRENHPRAKLKNLGINWSKFISDMQRKTQIFKLVKRESRMKFSLMKM
jgi:hypothetical protein